MAKERTTGSSFDYIIHPGETIFELLADRGINQKELAIRTGMTEKHISTVIAGKKNISPAFAKRLEYAFNIEAAFFINLQAIYDKEIIEFNEAYDIKRNEENVVKRIKEVVEYWKKCKIITNYNNNSSLIIETRKILNISNLCDIQKFQLSVVYRMQKKNNIDPYVLYAWIKTSELLSKKYISNSKLDIFRLKKEINNIKSIMKYEPNCFEIKLNEILNKCGITLCIVPNFKGAPVQGFIKNNPNGSLMLCITIRQKYADIFWFTLFHEIAHILNGDYNKVFVDYSFSNEKHELAADILATDLLINPNEYQKFKSYSNFSNTSIHNFANSQNVADYIVKGRLMHDKILKWSDREKYMWVESGE